MARRALPDVPFVQAHLQGEKQNPSAILIRLSGTASDKGAALGIANYMHSTNAPNKSHHYILDEASTYCGLPDDVAAYSAPYRSISVLVCAEPKEHVGRWDEHPELLNRTANLVAQLCSHHRIRRRQMDYVAKEHWLNWRWRINGGIIINVEGEWPYELFDRLLANEYAKV